MKFEWDGNKAKKNFAKHKISFEQAVLIFADPHVLTIPDEIHSDEEEREISMGIVPQGKTLVVVHTARIRSDGEWTRLISARAAEKDEEVVYYLKRGTE